MKELLDCEELSARELFVVSQIARGYEIKEIANHLCLSEQTVTTHLKNTYQKLGIHKKTELVSWYYAKLINGNGKGKQHIKIPNNENPTETTATAEFQGSQGADLLIQ